jgi:hypothetical protein
MFNIFISIILNNLLKNKIPFKNGDTIEIAQELKQENLIDVAQGIIIDALESYLNLRNVKIAMRDESFIENLEDYIKKTTTDEVKSKLHNLQVEDIKRQKQFIHHVNELKVKKAQDKKCEHVPISPELAQCSAALNKTRITIIYNHRNPFLSENNFPDLIGNKIASNYPNKSGICAGLSHLWAFSQRQEERKDTKSQLDDISKLRVLIKKLVHWYNNLAKEDGIDWRDERKKDHQPDSTKIKSEEIEMLISTINLLHNSANKLFVESDSEKLVGKNNMSEQGFHLFESSEKNKEGNEILKSPKKINYTLPHSLNKENLLSELNHSIKPGLLTKISLSGNEGAHAISVYMKEDHTIMFYDPNHGETDCGKEMIKVVDLIASQNSKYDNFFIETWYFDENKELEKESLKHAKEYIVKFFHIKSYLIENCDYKKIEALTSCLASIFAKDAPESYKELLSKAKDLSFDRIEKLTSGLASIFAKDAPESYKALLSKAKELSFDRIEKLTSSCSISFAKDAPESYKELLSKAKDLPLEQIEKLTSSLSLAFAKNAPESYKALLSKAKELSDKQIEALTSICSINFVKDAPESYKELLSKAKDLSFDRIEKLTSGLASIFAKDAPESYKALLSKAKDLQPEQIEKLTSLDSMIFAKEYPNSYKELLSKAKDLQPEQIEKLTSSDSILMAESCPDLYGLCKHFAKVQSLPLSKGQTTEEEAPFNLDCNNLDNDSQTTLLGMGDYVEYLLEYLLN